MSPAEPNLPTPLKPLDRLTVGVWRHGLMPTFAALRGMSAPPGRVSERRYGDLPDETMDVIAPAPNVTERSPVVFIHGGGWIGGSKGRFYHRPLLGLADAGHPVFSLNYPLAPERPHPGVLRSLLRALSTLEGEGRVATGVHLVGDSAGGNLATMLGLMLTNRDLLRRIDANAPEARPQVRSVASLYGVHDRLSWLEDGFPSARLFLQSYAGAAALDRVHAPPIPVTAMDVPEIAQTPPTFIGVGSKDRLARSSRIYAEHLASRSAPVTYKVYDGADHGFYCFAEPQGDALRTDVATFIAAAESRGAGHPERSA